MKDQSILNKNQQSTMQMTLASDDTTSLVPKSRGYSDNYRSKLHNSRLSDKNSVQFLAHKHILDQREYVRRQSEFDHDGNTSSLMDDDFGGVMDTAPNNHDRLQMSAYF